MAEDIKKVDEKEKAEGANATPENNGGKQLPAENGEKKGFHPIQWFKDFKQEFVEKHPVAARRIRKGVDMCEGAVIGGAVVFGTLAAIGSQQQQNDDEYDTSDLDLNPVDEDPNIIDMPESNDQ